MFIFISVDGVTITNKDTKEIVKQIPLKKFRDWKLNKDRNAEINFKNSKGEEEKFHFFVQSRESILIDTQLRLAIGKAVITKSGSFLQDSVLQQPSPMVKNIIDEKKSEVKKSEEEKKQVEVKKSEEEKKPEEKKPE